MIEDIRNYVEYLKRELGLTVSIHSSGGGLDSVIRRLSPYNVHDNPFCMYVKSSRSCWDRCIRQQEKVSQHCQEDIFFGSCYCGVGEYVIPVKNNDVLLGFVSVSGYVGDRAKLKHLVEKREHSEELLYRYYEKCLSAQIPDIQRVKMLTAPLCAMLVLYCRENPTVKGLSNTDYIFSHAILFLQSSYSEDIGVDEVAAYCHCSRSYISHIFRKKMDKSVNRYLTELRIGEAVKLLAETSLSVSEIGFTVGFSDSNYFSYVFSREMGISPRAYRKQLEC